MSPTTMVATAIIWGSRHLSFGIVATLPGIPLLHWDSLPALHAFCRVIAPKCRPWQDILLLKAFPGLSLPSGHFCAPDTGARHSWQLGPSLPSSACTGHPPPVLLCCLGFSLLSEALQNGRGLLAQFYFSFPLLGERYWRNQSIYIHMPLSHEILYLRDLFPSPWALSFTAVVHISEPARIVMRKKTNMKYTVTFPPRNLGKI